MEIEKEVFSHFIQRGFAKNFAINGVVKYIKYPNGELSSFNLNDNNSEHPIAIKGFFSNDIETGMNNLESNGIDIIKKIAQTAQFCEEVSLNRKELITLKFYSLLSGFRTHKLRNNILNRTGDSLFNKIINEAGDDPKNIQQKMIKTILKYWDSNKNELTGDYLIDMNKYINDKITQLCLVIISNTMNSRLLIFKFNSKNLLLTEALNFTEQNKKSGGILLDFMPIFSNIGIAFYFDPVIARRSDVTSQKSEIFENDISNIIHINEYVNFELMKRKQIEYLKYSQNIYKDSRIFWATEAKKYHHKNDKYIYKVLKESKNSASICNAMALVQCQDSYVIFQNKDDIKEAKRFIAEKGIYRAEDFQ